jgi:hypothetical protein
MLRFFKRSSVTDMLDSIELAKDSIVPSTEVLLQEAQSVALRAVLAQKVKACLVSIVYDDDTIIQTRNVQYIIEGAGFNSFYDKDCKDYKHLVKNLKDEYPSANWSERTSVATNKVVEYPDLNISVEGLEYALTDKLFAEIAEMD